MTEHLAQVAGLIVAITAALTIIVSVLRKASKKSRLVLRRADMVAETLLGRPAIVHPDSGEVLADATPGLGTRLGHIEGAIVNLAKTQSDVGELTKRVDTLSATVQTHITHSNSNAQAAHEEQTAMWQAIKAIAKSSPNE